MVSLFSDLLQPVSISDLIPPNGNGTAVSIDQNHMQLSSLVNQRQALLSTQSVSSSATSARLADDTYTPSTQNSGTASKVSSSSVNPAIYDVASSKVALADLIRNQTISGSADVREVLLAAIQSISKGDPEATAWNELTDQVNSGDYSGAQAALADYGTALVNSHIGMWADLSPIKSAMTALGSALQAGNADDIQAAFTALTGIAPTHNLGLIIPGITGKTIPNLSWAAANMADALQQLGYTATNAAAEADAWMMGYAADALTIHVITPGQPPDEISERSDVDQSIADLARAAAQSTDKNMLSSIIASMAQANTVTAMESTLTQLDSKYGTAAQRTGADNASQASVSVYA